MAGAQLLESVLRRADAGDEIALRAITEVGRWLGLGIGNLVNIFNPELVVLGGLYHPLFPYLEDSVRAGARFGALDAPGHIVEITSSGLGSDALLIGAAELAMSEVIADPARRQRSAR
jgi:predicted NBD/HSP70 family sugar kinase